MVTRRHNDGVGGFCGWGQDELLEAGFSVWVPVPHCCLSAKEGPRPCSHPKLLVPANLVALAGAGLEQKAGPLRHTPSTSAISAPSVPSVPSRRTTLIQTVLARPHPSLTLAPLPAPLLSFLVATFSTAYNTCLIKYQPTPSHPAGGAAPRLPTPATTHPHRPLRLPVPSHSHG